MEGQKTKGVAALKPEYLKTSLPEPAVEKTGEVKDNNLLLANPLSSVTTIKHNDVTSSADTDTAADQHQCPTGENTELANEKGQTDTQTGTQTETHTETPTKTSKKRKRGQNKKRAKFSKLRDEASDRICPLINTESQCWYGENCKFLHDIGIFMAKKSPDIGDHCYNFDTFGKCLYSFACRFAGAHIQKKDDEYHNVSKDVGEVKSRTFGLDKSTQVMLRKHKFDFGKADQAYKDAKSVVAEIVKTNVAIHCSGNSNKPPTAEAASVDCDTNRVPQCTEDVQTLAPDSEKVGPITNEDRFSIKPGEKKTVDFRNKLYLAPLTTVGNLPFRRICKTFGADITCGEMAMATKILQGVNSECALLKRHSSEDLFGVQLAGAFADTMARCTQLLNESYKLDFIDINVGCPIDMIFDQGAGSALMRRTNRFQEMMRAMVSVSNIPITCKIRTGVTETKNTAHQLIPKIRDWGASLCTLHGRSREQRYTKLADWHYIKECSEIAEPMPLFGGGDILSLEDYLEATSGNSVSGVMIARGALIKPWIFDEIKQRRTWDISSKERLDILRDFANFGLEHWGSDSQGVETTRQFMLEWLSFLYRYIPYGLLERGPQKINERPPPYYGRDDLETLMASPNSADWIKISEMLLGPVPSGFFFIPKHKANSY